MPIIETLPGRGLLFIAQFLSSPVRDKSTVK